MSDTHAESIAFVRETSLPPVAPPDKVGGPLKWVKDNLFPTWANAILTIVALYFLYLLVSGSLPWLLNGVWSASSLSECREILDGATGACFSVLSERWHQLLFGFKYPSDQYWRPTLALVLLFLAAAPVLFIDLPRKLLLFTGVYPFLAFWLIWGGPIWGPIFALLGVVAGYVVYSRLVQKSFAMALAGGVVAAVIVWYIGGFIGEALRPASPLLQSIPSRDLGGFMLNMMLGITCVSLSLPIGIALALGRQSHLPIVKGICVVFIEFVRGVPLITLLFVANVMLAYFFPPGSGVDLFIRVVIMITMFSSAYIAEVIRGGLAALPKGQYEAADSLGLDYPQAMRLIILPQALKISIPGIVNTFIGLFKDTTLVSVIGLLDPVGIINPIRADSNWNGIVWEFYVFVGLFFWVFCFAMSRYSMYLERKLATDHR